MVGVRGNPSWKKGISGNPKGRPKDPLNLGKEVVQAMKEAFHEAGGKDWLLNLAHTDQKTFAGLLARTIPTDISATVTHTVIDLGQAMQEANARLEHMSTLIDVTPTTDDAGDQQAPDQQAPIIEGANKWR